MLFKSKKDNKVNEGIFMIFDKSKYNLRYIGSSKNISSYLEDLKPSGVYNNYMRVHIFPFVYGSNNKNDMVKDYLCIKECLSKSYSNYAGPVLNKNYNRANINNISICINGMETKIIISNSQNVKKAGTVR